MKKLFTFGCSFTNYNWPTWADLLGQEYFPHFNWGYAGLGNRAIADRVAEAHARMPFEKDDVVIVQWSSPLRHDWMRTDLPKTEGTYWRTHGSIFSIENAKTFDQRWMQTFWDEKAYMIQTLNAIVATQEFLNGVGVEWYMTSMNDITKMGNHKAPSTMGGEYQAPSTTLKHFWEVDNSLQFYKEAIWDRYPDKWVDPIMNVIPETEDLNWTFKFDKNRPEEKSYPLKDGMWEEAHPTSHQHAIWMLELKNKMGLEPILTSAQVDLIKEVEAIKAATSTFKEFEDSMRTTEWFVERNYRGL